MYNIAAQVSGVELRSNFMSISKIILTLLAIWGTLVIILGLLKIHIVFPFNIADAESIPYHRWQSVRFSAFATVIYLIIRYLIGGRPEGALMVVSVFFRFLVLFGAILIWQADLDASEWWGLSFFIFVTLLVHKEMRENPRQRHW